MTAKEHPEWVLLYDGPCALCQGAVRWMMARDRHHVFYYSPLQGDWAANWKKRYASEVAWSDEVVLVAGTSFWVGSEAVAMALRQMPFPYSLLGRFYALLPGQKKIYRWLAQHRHTWFGKKEEPLTACPAPHSWREPHPRCD